MSGDSIQHEKQLRQNTTDAESCLWARLRNRQLGVKFRRQHRLGGCIVDFFCAEKGLVIELDSGQHQEQAASDEHRGAYLEAAGLRVIRFRNHDALARTDQVMSAIWQTLQDPTPPHPNQTSALPTNPIRSSLTLRANLYSTIRSFMAARGVLEVETPILSAGANTEPNIESFSTRFSGPLPDTAPRERWMRTSPEFALKRLLVQGVGDCYELGRVFRDGEAGRRHNPEFTMLEWYRIGWDHHELAEETSDLVERAIALVDQPLQRVRWTYRSLYQNAFGFDPFTAPLEQLKAPLADHGILADDLSRDDWLDLLMTHRLQADFPADALTLVIDFPPSQCALARISGQGEDAVAQRFELYLGDKELANGYHELTDAAEQRARFENDNRRRLARGQRELPIDGHLLAALETGLPECAGVALGIERLLMAMVGTDRIADVLAFAFDQA